MTEDSQDVLRTRTTDDQTWLVPLTRYERDNLLALINAIGYPHPRAVADPALAKWNNGDWVGQIALKLRRLDGSFLIDAQDRPNYTFVPKTGSPEEAVDFVMETFQRLTRGLKNAKSSDEAKALHKEISDLFRSFRER